TARVTGPSMLSVDGTGHARHRAPFARAYRPGELSERLAGFTRAEAVRLAEAIRPAGQAELRTEVAGPLAAAVMTEALGPGGGREVAGRWAAGVMPGARGPGSVGVRPAPVLSWSRAIVAAVAALPAATPGPPVRVDSFAALAASLREAIAAGRAPLLADAA